MLRLFFLGLITLLIRGFSGLCMRRRGVALVIRAGPLMCVPKENCPALEATSDVSVFPFRFGRMRVLTIDAQTAATVAASGMPRWN